MSRIQFGRALMLFLLLALAPAPAAAQRGRRGARMPFRADPQQTKPGSGKQNQGKNQGKQEKKDNINPNGAGQPAGGNQFVSQDKQGGANQPGGNVRGMMGLPPVWIQRLQGMKPEEQERFLQNNARFQSLPPERQAQIRENLRRWNGLTQDQRDAIMHRQELLQKMTPEEREQLRTEILPKWKALPPARRQVLRQKLLALQDLSDSEREARLKDPAFLQGLNPDDQDLLRRLSALRIGPAAEPPRNPSPPPLP